MNLYSKLLQRKDNPLRIGVIGAGKFGAMYLAQVPRTPGVHLVGIADLSPDGARRNLARVGWSPKASEYTTPAYAALAASIGPHRASASTVTLTTCFFCANASRQCSTAATGEPVHSTIT